MLECHVEGDPVPRIYWHSNRAGKLDKRGHNYRVSDNGTLEFVSIEKDDEAGYWCKAKNMFGVAESDEAEVIVESPTEIVEYPENTHANRGEDLELQCTATGDPAPIITWLKNGHQVTTFQICILSQSLIYLDLTGFKLLTNKNKNHV